MQPLEYYLVGGAVRDQLLGIEGADLDWVVVGHTVQDMLDRGFQQVGKDFPVFLHPETKQEYALARQERKTGSGHDGFACFYEPTVSLEQDLQRRDLTINAIAKNQHGELIDPYNGQADLNKKILRHVSAAFSEDPLRVLRVARFYARFAHLGFQIAPETLSLMQQIAKSGELQTLSTERVWQETQKALLSTSAHYFFLCLQRCGALEQLFPELDTLFFNSLPLQQITHIEQQDAEIAPLSKNGQRSLATLMQTKRLIQSLEKPLNQKQHIDLLFSSLTYLLNDKKSLKSKMVNQTKANSTNNISQLCRRLRVASSTQTLALLCSQHYQQCHDIIAQDAETILQLLKTLDAFRDPKKLRLFLMLCEADFHAQHADNDIEYKATTFLNQCFAVAAACKAAMLDAETLKQGGKIIGDKLDQLRCQAIQTLQERVF